DGIDMKRQLAPCETSQMLHACQSPMLIIPSGWRIASECCKERFHLNRVRAKIGSNQNSRHLQRRSRPAANVAKPGLIPTANDRVYEGRRERRGLCRPIGLTERAGLLGHPAES